MRGMKIQDNVAFAVEKLNALSIFTERNLSVKEIKHIDRVYDMVGEAYSLLEEEFEESKIVLTKLYRSAEMYGVFRGAEEEPVFRILLLPTLNFIFIADGEIFGTFSYIKRSRSDVRFYSPRDFAELIFNGLLRVDRAHPDGVFAGVAENSIPKILREL